MTATEHRTFLGLCKAALGVRQGLHPKHGGGRVRAFCDWLRAHGQPKAYATLLRELDEHGAPQGRGTAKLGVSTLVALCRYTRNTHPLRYLARLVGEKMTARKARRSQRRNEIEVAA